MLRYVTGGLTKEKEEERGEPVLSTRECFDRQLFYG